MAALTEADWEKPLKDYDNYINGKFGPSSSRDRIKVTNPSTGELICTVPNSNPADVDETVAVAENAQPTWAQLPANQRAKKLNGISSLILGSIELLAPVISEEQGKTLGWARVESAFTADYIDYIAEWARRI